MILLPLQFISFWIELRALASTSTACFGPLATQLLNSADSDMLLHPQLVHSVEFAVGSLAGLPKLVRAMHL